MKLFSLCFFMTGAFANVAYIGHETSLSIVDTKTNLVEGEISLGANPVLIAITPNNLFAYVTLGSNNVAVIETATNEVVTTIDTDPGPIGLAITPNGKLVYVANQYGTVSVISTKTNTVIDTIPGFSMPWGIAITPNGKFAYVVNLNGGSSPGFVSVIDLATNTVLPFTIEVGFGPTGLTITPDGQFVYVTNQNGNTVSVIATAVNQVIKTIPVGINPFEAAANPNGRYVYISNNSYTSPTNGSISVISTLSNDVVATITLGSADPADLAVTSDGKRLYVTNTENTSVISTLTNEVIDTITGSHTSSVAITGTLIGDLLAKQRLNDFGVVYEFFNRLTWKPTPHSDVRGYLIFRNGKQIASVNSRTLRFDDHDQRSGVPTVYRVAPIEASGLLGGSLKVVVQ